MQIVRHAFVVLEYSLRDDDGQLIDSSEQDGPIEYVHGTDSLLPGLERALEGKAQGDTLTVRLPADQAYGEPDDDLIERVARAELPDDIELEVGLQLETAGDDDDDEGDVVTVIAIEGDEVVLDANHPLAGIALNFEVTVALVRLATPEELAEAEHGHAGCDGDHEH